MEIVNRMIRAAKLDVSLYEEVEKDAKATNQALLVVVIAAICSGIGTAIAGGMIGGITNLIAGLILGALSVLFLWLIWSFLTYFIGTRLFKGPKTEATYSELLRCIGFSATPGILMILRFIPILGVLIAIIIVPIWILVAMIIAVRQALDFTTIRAIATCLVGFIAYIIIQSIVNYLSGFLML